MEKMCAWAQRFGLRLLALLFLCLPMAWADDFLPPEKAFVFSAISADGQSIQLHWDVAPGYHLYKDRISVQPDRPGIELAPLAMPAAKQVFDDYVKALAHGIVSIFNMLDPEVIVLGGGVSMAGEYLLDAVRAAVKPLVFFKTLPYPSIQLARLGADAGIIGAALLGRA